jgi:hypothetical protein
MDNITPLPLTFEKNSRGISQWIILPPFEKNSRGILQKPIDHSSCKKKCSPSLKLKYLFPWNLTNGMTEFFHEKT